MTNEFQKTITHLAAALGCSDDGHSVAVALNGAAMTTTDGKNRDHLRRVADRIIQAEGFEREVIARAPGILEVLGYVAPVAAEPVAAEPESPPVEPNPQRLAPEPEPTSEPELAPSETPAPPAADTMPEQLPVELEQPAVEAAP